MGRRAHRAAVAGVGLVLWGAGAVHAQGGTLQAVAQVRPALTAVALRNLDFGSVFQGVAKTIPVGSTGSGRFRVDGEANAQVTLSFALPADLSNGSALLPIHTWTGYHNNAANTNNGTAFTPSGASTLVQLSPAGRRFVWVGATVSPTPTQATGAYSATITLTLDYP